MEDKTEIIHAVIEPLNKLTVPVASSAGKTLSDIWELVFGGFGLYIDKKRIQRTQALEEFKQTLSQNVSAIPPNDLIEPKLSVVGPALEASKYYFEEKELRDMFASLIASAMDRRKTVVLHPSYVEIIRQLSSLDAQNLVLFQMKTLPVAKYWFSRPNGSPAPTNTIIFLSNPQEIDIDKQSVSMEHLRHLGLLEIDFETHLVSPDAYQAFYETPLFLNFKNIVSNSDTFSAVNIKKGIARLTTLGEFFLYVCYPDFPKGPSPSAWPSHLNIGQPVSDVGLRTSAT